MNDGHGITGALARWANEGGAQVVPLPSKYGTGAASAGTGSNVAGCAIEDERTIKIEEREKRK
jgi:hypothetical protein